jgi:hypothetical protein
MSEVSVVVRYDGNKVEHYYLMMLGKSNLSPTGDLIFSTKEMIH